MSDIIKTESTGLASKIEQVLMSGDLERLSPEERVNYHTEVCKSLGLNPLTSPFAYIKLNGKLLLYAKKDCTDQLRNINNISIKILDKSSHEGLYMVTASAIDKSGRIDESTGVVDIQGLKGANLANALMKAESKAKRRVTLSICGLGMLDETEVEDVQKATKDVTATNNHFLPESSSKSHDALIQAFMAVDVSLADILTTYGINDITQLDDESVVELREIYTQMKSGEKSFKDFFFTDAVNEGPDDE